MPADTSLALRADAFGTVFLLVQHLSRMTDEALEDWGLTTRQWLLLAVLAKAFPTSSPSLTEAAAVYGSSRQNVKQIALGLESRGFLRLVPDAVDGRTTRIERTGKVRMFDEPDGIARSAALLDRAFGDLSDDEVGQLRSLLARWAAGIGAAPDPGPRPKAGAAPASDADPLTTTPPSGGHPTASLDQGVLP